MKNREKINLAIGLLLLIGLFAGCREESQALLRELPEPPIQETPAPVIEEPSALPEPVPEEPPPEEEARETTYILNTNTKRFHRPACRSAGQIKPGNFRETSDSREELLDEGYSPCGNCNP